MESLPESLRACVMRTTGRPHQGPQVWAGIIQALSISAFTPMAMEHRRHFSPRGQTRLSSLCCGHRVGIGRVAPAYSHELWLKETFQDGTGVRISELGCGSQNAPHGVWSLRGKML